MEKITDDTGIIFIHPNPENPDRYVVVWTTRILSVPENGLQAGFIMPLNLLPDYVVVQNKRIVTGSHFDGDWKLNNKTLPH